MVREEVERFERWLASLDVVPTISALRRRGDQIVEQVLRENESRWESLSEADRERVELMARAVVSPAAARAHAAAQGRRRRAPVPLRARAARAVRARRAEPARGRTAAEVTRLDAAAGHARRSG